MLVPCNASEVVAYYQGSLTHELNGSGEEDGHADEVDGDIDRVMVKAAILSNVQ